MDITHFNPRAQDENDFLATFVARQDVLEFLLRQLRLLDPARPATHHLIIAPRGYGKTSLLRRVAIAVRTEHDLKDRLIALSFREEQHNVISLDVFWRNCLQSLMEVREDEQAPDEEIAQLEAAWDKHAPRQALKGEDQDGAPAKQTFKQHCAQIGRRPVLLIDNLDTLLAGLPASHQWALRNDLQTGGGPILIAAASRYPASTHDQQSAFYDFFRIQTLNRLSDNEVMRCLRIRAHHRGEPGKQVIELIDRNPGRVAALNTLAGGNPRTLGVLYSVLESHTASDVLAQLKAMLDTFTGWYQARTEELPVQSRAVFDALALNWDPITAAKLGEATGLDTTTVSSQLARLEKAGYVESVSLSTRKQGRSGYQVSERFFNIWYLMRNGPRRTLQSIRFLTVFLQSCFSLRERQKIAHTALEEGRIDPGYALALASSMPASGVRIEPAWRLPSVSRHLSLPELDADISRLSSATDLQSRTKLAMALVNKGTTLGQLGKSEDAIRVYDDVVARFGDASEAALREPVGRALNSLGNLFLETMGDAARALRTFESGLALDLPTDDKNFLHANHAYALALHADNVPAALVQISRLLANEQTFSQSGRDLLRGLSSLGEPVATRWQSLFGHILTAIEREDDSLWNDYLDDLQRLLWYVLVQGKGAEFLLEMRARQMHTKFAPLYHAFAAAIEGEDYLLKINPETRQAALRIYEGLARRLRLYPEPAQASVT